MATIMRYDPFDELNRIQRDMTRLIDDNFRGITRSADSNGGSSHQLSARTWAPAVDVRDEGDSVVIHAELPGIKQEDIDIELTGDTLTLRGERKFEDTEKSKNYVRIERSYGSFQRTFNLGVPVQNDKVAASYKDGILTITLPKSEAVQPKKISVAAN
jgi:HSP20 family protein